MFSLSSRARRAGAALAVLVLVAAVGLVAVSERSRSTTYYLALGDSLSVGVQPTATGANAFTDAGYVNDLYAHYRATNPHLELVQMGCPRETTASAISGQGNAAAAQQYHCDRSGGSQLTAALAFLKAHRGQVKLITVDLGINDVNACLTGAVFARGTAATLACIRAGERSIAAHEPTFLRALAHAAAPGTALAGATIYDSFLSGARLRHTQYGATATAVALASVPLIGQVNSVIGAADVAAGFRTADVAGAFETYDTTRPPASTRGGAQPRNLIALCVDTWACTPAPQGPNIHPNARGYALIARAFEGVLPRLG